MWGAASATLSSLYLTLVLANTSSDWARFVTLSYVLQTTRMKISHIV